MTMTVLPAVRSRCTVAAPIPDAPPLTTATAEEDSAMPGIMPNGQRTSRRQGRALRGLLCRSMSRRARWSAYVLAGTFAGAGVSHFTAPWFYERIIPTPLKPWKRELVYWSGVCELACAAGLAIPRTRRLTGWASAALLLAVFPANVQQALDGGLPDVEGIGGSAEVAWARLPLQLPLVWMALAVARDRTAT